MESIIQVLSYETFQGDIIVWLTFTESIFFIIAAVLVAIEPMACGGMNRVFHYLLALLFSAEAFQGLQRASARAIAVTTGGPAIPAEALIISDLLTTVIVVLVTAKLGYDYFAYREYRRVSRSSERRKSTDCPMRRRIY